MGAAQKSETQIEAKVRTSAARERFGAFADDILLTEVETAQIVGFSANTLKFWRLNGSTKGPPVTKVYGAVRYRVGGLRKWLSRFTDNADEPVLGRYRRRAFALRMSKNGSTRASTTSPREPV
jgi:hypothetical protein